MYMNSQNYKDDVHKNQPTEEEATRIAELKKRLYSAAGRESAVRERGFKPHRIDVGKNWSETDEKQAKLEELQLKKEEEAKLGFSNENYMHHGSTLYGHYSPAEEVTKTKKINTGFEKKAPTMPIEETAGSFMSDKLADKRAAVTQKKLAHADVELRYASAQLEQLNNKTELYPHLNSESKLPPVAPKEESSIDSGYHPDFNVLTVGGNRLDNVSRKVVHDSLNKKTGQDNTASIEQKKRFSFAMFFFATVFVFFLGAVGYGYMTLKKGTNVVSPDKVEIAVSGPISVRAGQVNDFAIEITNRNAIDLTLSDLVIQYPYGTMSAVDSTQSLTNERIAVGTIKPGETVRKRASAVFFGEENVKKNINYALEFSIADSANIFSATKDIGVVISGSPVTARITNVKEITNNQDLSFDIEIQSNTEEVVKNIQLQVEYPFGYKLTQSNLEPAFGNNTWNIPEIAALDTKVIHLNGKLIGTSNLEKNFRFTLGVADVKTGEMITVLSTQDQKVLIAKPFVSTKLSLDGVVQDFRPVTYEDTIQGDIVFTNNLDVPITDAVVELSIGGVLVDRTSVKANNGFYRSSDDVLFWDKSQEERLALIDPGESREVSFNFAIIRSRESLIQTLRRSTSGLSVTVKGKRLNEKLVPEEITSVIKQELRLETNPTFSSRIGFKSGPFVNTGNFPPRINSETTYTYTGRITNTANTLKDTVFVAKLPPNVTWKNIYSKDIPASAVSYSPGKREITINLGNISAGTGIDTGVPPKEFSFQVGFTPTLTQLGATPSLIITPRISGVDSFTNRRIERGVDALTIVPTADVGNVGDGSVTE